MNCEKLMQKLENIVADESIPEEMRAEFEWISYEDLEDGVDLLEVLEHIKENYPEDEFPAKLSRLQQML